MNTEIGTPIWDEEEISQEKARVEEMRFFKDGVATKVILAGVEKEEKTSQKGNDYILHHYAFQSEDGREKKLTDYDFSFTNALSKFKVEGTKLVIGQKLVVTATVIGQNDKGYDIFKYNVDIDEKAKEGEKKGEEVEKEEEDDGDEPF